MVNLGVLPDVADRDGHVACARAHLGNIAGW